MSDDNISRGQATGSGSRQEKKSPQFPDGKTVPFERRELLAGTLDNIMEGCQIIGFDWRYLYINNAAAIQGKSSVEQLVGRTMMECYPGIERSDLFGTMRRCMEGRIPQTMENEFVFPDGGVGWFQLSIQPVPEGIVILSLDVTERKRAERLQMRLASALEQSAEGIIITDTSGMIEYVNSAFENMTGYSREDLIGKDSEMLRSDRQTEGYFKDIWSILKKGEAWSGRLTAKRKDGRLFEEEVTISPVLDRKGQIVNYVASQRDITERLALEDQLRQAQKMEVVGRMAGGIAHDFNNILTAIMGYSELLSAKLKGQSSLQQDVSEIRKGAERAAGLTHQLLAFSRKQVLEMGPLNLNTVVRGLERMLRRIIGENIELSVELDEDIGTTLADRGQIEQVIMNLVVNAGDAMPEGGKLSIKTYREDSRGAMDWSGADNCQGPCATLAVEDSGTGMDEETKARIFEPFFTTKEHGKGTGLGLATVYGIIHQCGGHIAVESSPGVGSVFKIYLPERKSLAMTRKIPIISQEKVIGCETILVVEDDENIRNLILRLLSDHGYNALGASNPGEALRICQHRNGQIHLILTDMVMPGMSGRELTERLKKSCPDIRVVWMSGYTDVAFDGPEDMLGAEFIQKPFKPLDLLKKIRQMLDVPEIKRTVS